MKVIKDLGSKIPANSRSNNPRPRKHLLVECECGNQWEVLAENYNAGKVTMCKMCQNKLVSEVNGRNKGYKNRKPSRLRTIYNNMLDRCYNPSNPAYKDYGAKGVTVCEEWKNAENGFLVFQEWALANGYKDNLVCDKDHKCNILNINPKLYSANTCTWITPEENGGLTSRLPEAEQLIIVKRYLNKEAIKSIAADYGYTYQGIMYILEKHGAHKRNPNKRTKTPSNN